MSQNRVQPGVPEGGQFAATKRAGADPSVALAEPPQRKLPDEIAAGIPAAEEITELSDAAYENYRTAEDAIHKVDELRLAREAEQLYTEHGVTAIHLRSQEDVEGYFVMVDSIDLDTGYTLEEGVEYEDVHDVVMNIGFDAEKFDSVDPETYDLIDLMRRAPELEREIEAAFPKPINVTETIELAETLRMASDQPKIKWTEDGGETIRSGVVRTGIWNADGQPVRDADARDAYLRITTSTGAETFKPAALLTKLRREGALAIDD